MSENGRRSFAERSRLENDEDDDEAEDEGDTSDLECDGLVDSEGRVGEAVDDLEEENEVADAEGGDEIEDDDEMEDEEEEKERAEDEEDEEDEEIAVVEEDMTGTSIGGRTI